MFIALAMVLLKGGDCISPLFADQESKDCCTRGKCNPSQKADPCCQTTSPSATQYFQPTTKITLDQNSLVLTDTVIDVAQIEPSFVAVNRDFLEMEFKSPPAVAQTVSLPLLI